MTTARQVRCRAHHTDCAANLVTADPVGACKTQSAGRDSAAVSDARSRNRHTRQYPLVHQRVRRDTRQVVLGTHQIHPVRRGAGFQLA